MDNICNIYDASSIQQLTKLVTDIETGNLKDKNIFPTSIIQAIFDGKSGIRLDSILSCFNFLFVPFAGTNEATRLQIPLISRRKSLIITYRNFNDEIILEQYIGDSKADSEWSNRNNWQAPFKDGNFIVNIDKEDLRDIVENYFSTDEGRAFIESIIIDNIQGAVNNYFASEEFSTLVSNAIQDKVQPVIDELVADVRNIIETNERVVANALSRHEEDIMNLKA